jgi:putative phosphoesterase
MTHTAAIKIGLISDTHGLLRPQALQSLQGSDFIIHAGDICDADVLKQLSALAPVTAVRGNNDRGMWADAIPETNVLEAGAALLYVIHNIDELDIDPGAAGFHAVIYGHSHKPMIEKKHGVLFMNPGSAGPRRFSLPVSTGQLLISGTHIAPQLIALEV